VTTHAQLRARLGVLHKDIQAHLAQQAPTTPSQSGDSTKTDESSKTQSQDASQQQQQQQQQQHQEEEQEQQQEQQSDVAQDDDDADEDRVVDWERLKIEPQFQVCCVMWVSVRVRCCMIVC
jgi:hypothetical protein